MRRTSNVLVAFLATTSSALNLWVASQSGIIATVELINNGAKFDLQQTSSTPDCGSSPTWLMPGEAANVLYCIDENLTGGPGHITSFNINDDGSLVKINSAVTGTGPVHSTLFGSQQKGVAVAEYAQGGLSTYSLLQPSGNFVLNEQIIFPPLATPGPVPDRQTKNFAHEAVLDPTGKFILIPDLGADKLRVFSFNDETLQLKEELATSVPPGSGPRHGAFAIKDGVTRFYIVNELSANIYGFNVTYPAGGGMKLDLFEEVFTHGSTSAAGNAPGELEVTSDHRFLTISNRLTGDIPIENPDPSKPGMIHGDSLSTFQINEDGTLTFLEATSSGGISPRQFETSKCGKLVAVANYASSNIAIFPRDLDTGLIGKEPLASYFFEGPNQSIAAVIWND